MNVNFVELIVSEDGTEKIGELLFQGKNYIPRLDDHVLKSFASSSKRPNGEVTVYKTVHVEWVYGNQDLPAPEPERVDVLLQKLPIAEPPKDEPVMKYRDGEVMPFKQKVQTNNCYCCRCGGGIAQNLERWHAVVPLNMGAILTVQRISWCFDCWKAVPGSSSYPE